VIFFISAFVNLAMTGFCRCCFTGAGAGAGSSSNLNLPKVHHLI